jgi:hypothetical protein
MAWLIVVKNSSYSFFGFLFGEFSFLCYSSKRVPAYIQESPPNEILNF